MFYRLLILYSLLISSLSFAAVVEKIKSNHVLIRLDGMQVQAGDELAAIQSWGVVKLKVTKVGHIKAAADMINGSVKIGDTIYRSDDPAVQRIATETKTKKEKFQKRQGWTLKAGYDFANKYNFAGDGAAIPKTTLATSNPFFFSIGYQKVEKNSFGWDLSWNQETKRTANSFDLCSTSQCLETLNNTIVGLELNLNYGFALFDSLSYAFAGLGKYTASFTDSSNSGSMIGLELGIGGFFYKNFTYDILYRSCRGPSGLGNFTLDGAIVRFGYLFDFN